jgi:hypothetical protein
VALAAGAASGQDPASGADKKVVAAKAAIVGYAANVSAFPYYKCRYRCTKGQAKSVEEAIQGKLTSARFHDNRLLVSDEKDLYEGFAPPPDPKQAVEVPGKKGHFRVMAPGNSDRYLGDGKREMGYSPVLRAINLYSKDTSHYQVSDTPLGMGLIGHRSSGGPDVLLTRKDRYDFSVAGMEEVDGRPVVTVRFNDRKTWRRRDETIAFALVFSFDGSRGNLPIRMALLWNEKPRTQVFVTHARECSGQRWFPERTVVVDLPDKPGAPCDVLEIKLLELDADQRPDASEFFFTIPAGTSVLRFGEGQKFFRLKQDEKISIEDLPRLFKMVDESAQKPLMDTAIPRPRPYRWVGAVTGLALALGGGLYLVRRRLRIRQSAPGVH